MANIRKSFNFRSGLQVDNDNFIVNSNGLVGIGTSVASEYLLNVYGDSRITGLITASNVSLSNNLNVGGITTVGFITASSLDVSGNANIGAALTVSQLRVGNSDLVDNLIGFARTTFLTDNGGVGLHTTSKIGVNTTTSPGASDAELNVNGNVDITGIATANEFSGLLSGNVNSVGVSTFTTLKVGTEITASSGVITATTFEGALTGDVTGTATTATNLASGANITTGTISDARLPDIITSNINILTGTSYFQKIGVNTTAPISDIHVRNDIQSEIQVTSSDNASLIGLGRSDNITGFNGVLRYGNTDGAFSQFSDEYSLDIMNYGTGNINYYLNPSEIVGTTGGFFWHKETNRLMALTSAGNLGIGVTVPTRKLEVIGSAYVSGAVHFDSALTADSNIILGVNGRIGINSSTPTEKLDVDGNAVVTGSITAGSISTTNGTSTQFLKADGSVDNNTYLTSSTLSISDDTNPQLGGGLNINSNDITGTGNINVAGIITAFSFTGSGSSLTNISYENLLDTDNLGIVTASGGFTSGIGSSPVEINVIGSTLIFTVAGIGSTSLTLS